MALNEILDPVLRPLLDISPFFTVFIISFVLGIATTVVYKYTTNQTHLREVKAQLKKLQTKVKKLKDQPEKMMAAQKDVLKLNGEYMKSSLKSTLYTFLPLIIIFGWMTANLAWMPIMPNDGFGVNVELEKGTVGSLELILPDSLVLTEGEARKELSNNKMSWGGIAGPAGEHTVSVKHYPSEEEVFATLLITEEQRYLNPITIVRDSDIFNQVTIEHEKLLIFAGIPVLENFPILKNMNWFWGYFLFSIIFSTASRKIMKVA